MTRWTFVALSAATLAAALGAQGPPRPPGPVERHRLFERDRELIERVVERSLKVAAEDDPLERVRLTGEFLARLRSDIDLTGRVGDRALSRELTGHLDTLVREAVVPAVEQASRTATPGSRREEELRRLKGEELRRLERDAGSASPEDAGRLAEARRQLERAGGPE